MGWWVWIGVVVAVATATVCSPLLLVSSATISQGFLETPRPEMDWTVRNAIIITNECACMFAHIVYVFAYTPIQQFENCSKEIWIDMHLLIN